MVIEGFHVEVLAVACYAIFLLGAGLLLELLARHAHRRTERYDRGGFTYRRDMDLWNCPAGRQLVRIETDLKRQIVRYRAPRDFCNSCSLKKNCTDSDEGRVLEHRLDTWVESELKRFHSVISLCLMLLGMLMAMGELTRNRAPRELLLLVALILVICGAGMRPFSELMQRHPAG